MAENNASSPTQTASTRLRTYVRSDVVVVFKTKERFGELSNMSAGFPLTINGIRIPTSEALYQACRFPHLPDLQQKIIAQKSPMTAKMVGKPFRDQTREDWNRSRVKIMRWCLRVKLAQHWSRFGRILASTQNKPIVEQSRKDQYWGAQISKSDADVLVGENVLGRLLMELREELHSSASEELKFVSPPDVADFFLISKPIGAIDCRDSAQAGSVRPQMIGARRSMANIFAARKPNVVGNAYVRAPQQEAYSALLEYSGKGESANREIGIVLPVGCGKSGCIALAPFAFRANRALVIAPGLTIAKQLADDFDPSNSDMFYQKCHVLAGPPFPEPVEIRGTSSNRADLDSADVVITNIQQLVGGDSNRWIEGLPVDFFDLILFDEGHHSVAESWRTLTAAFPRARIVNLSATPLRSDGQLMAGTIVYSYPIFRAIQAGYVKRLKAVQLNPRTLRYVRRENGQEIEVGLDEVRRLGEEEADFRRSIVTSEETLSTIVDASIRELDRLRRETGDQRLKIIASALNLEHCRQIVESYRSRGRSTDYVHSREESASNQRVIRRLENHELDVIVQVRKLGEGFDHRYLAVAAVFSIFSNLSPFVQFVGRIMRVVVQNSPDNALNQGVVVFHAGANVARRWSDFQQYSEADREYFDQLLPLEFVDPTSTASDHEVTPVPRPSNLLQVKGQSEIELEVIHLIKEDEVAAIRLLQERGIISGDFDPASQLLKPVSTTKVAERRAKRASLDTLIRNEAARVLHIRKVAPEGHELDHQRLGRSNLIVLKAAIDRRVNQLVGRDNRQRHEFSRAELDYIEAEFQRLVREAIDEVFGGD
jgi:ribA/ribD-fused uncharacterized protein